MEELRVRSRSFVHVSCIPIAGSLRARLRGFGDYVNLRKDIFANTL